MICQNCKTSLQGDFKFCPGCGAPATAQKPFCPGCGKETQMGWQACPHCGQRLNSPSVSIPPQQNVVYEPRHGSYPAATPVVSSEAIQGNIRSEKDFSVIYLVLNIQPVINGYRIEESLGAGSFGAVARASRHNKRYALKALIPDKTENDLDREGHILSGLNHPRIPRFIETFSHKGVDYLVQELFTGIL